LKRLDPSDETYAIFTEALNRLNYGRWLDEEQLKSMYKWGWREGEWLTWLPDDFDDEY
jgi:hypothetical protein